MSDPIVGIDLGTTNSLVAMCDESGPRILAVDDVGTEVMPSVIRYGPDGVCALGVPARDQAIEHPLETIYSVKRLMGRGVQERSEDIQSLAYRVVEGPRGLASVEVDGKVRTPQEISADLLRALTQGASKALGTPIRRAVVTVPAYFDDAQRQATRDAGRLAGLEIVRIVNEPTAAAMAYGIGSRAKELERLAIYDLGGGTFDVTILEVIPPENENDEAVFRVLATAGDTHLGGDDLDLSLMNLVLQEVSKQVGHDVELTPAVRQQFRTLAEQAKIVLSEEASASISVDCGNDLGTVHRSIPREEFEKLSEPLLQRTIELCEASLRDAKLEPSMIDRVVLVGGSTRIPMVRRLVESFFGSVPYTALDPDRVVAMGAAVQASILAGQRTDMLLLDVVPLSLGLETVGGAVAKLIVRNSTIPTRAVEMFSTSVDGQVNVGLHIVQGERELVQDCRSLARFDLRGLPPMPAGIPQLEVEFVVDANGVLRVHALERRSGCRADVQVMPSFGLTQAEVEAMEEEAYRHAREDMSVHRVIDLGVNAALDVKWIQEALNRVRDVVGVDVISSVEDACEVVLGFIQEARRDPRSVDPEAFYAAKEALDRTSVPVHEAAIARSLRDEDGPETT